MQRRILTLEVPVKPYKTPSEPLCSNPTQRAQYPLIKEYSLNHNMKPYMI